ncbi:MAG: hypothetical protein GX283_10545 [Clostridiaceae bacterium]|nr:hypothetical protein [Clostridiaceae bacterium]
MGIEIASEMLERCEDKKKQRTVLFSLFIAMNSSIMHDLLNAFMVPVKNFLTINLIFFRN